MPALKNIILEEKKMTKRRYVYPQVKYQYKPRKNPYKLDYASIVKNINSCGLTKLKMYCTTKPYPVRNFDRDLEIIKYVLKYGPTAAENKYGVSTNGLLSRYNNYALEAVGSAS